MFQVRRTHPGLFSVTIVETFAHLAVGAFFLGFGSTAHATASGRHVYQPITLYGFAPLWIWGVFHAGVGLAMLTGLALDRWPVVKWCLRASFVTYNVMAFGLLLGLQGSHLTDIGYLTFLTDIVFTVSLSMFSLAAAVEPTINPANLR